MTSSKYPITTWDTNINHDAARIIYYLKRLPEQELQNRGFIVTPYALEKYKPKTIIIPPLPFSTIKNLWSHINKLTPTTPMVVPDKLSSDVIKLLEPVYHRPKNELEKIQKEWSIISSKFYNSLFQIIPGTQERLKSINIIVTRYGTCSQFNLIRPGLNQLTVYLRADAQTSNLSQAIILALIRYQLQYSEKRTWEEIEAISDFLLSKTILSQSLLPQKADPIMQHLQKQQLGKMVLASKHYQSQIGIPAQNNWTFDNRNIYYQSTIIDNLTKRQTHLLNLLICNYGKVVTNDQIGELLWADQPDQFSLWAIVKEIARIRSLLKQIGLPGHIIQSHRKLGYSLS